MKNKKTYSFLINIKKKEIIKFTVINITNHCMCSYKILYIKAITRVDSDLSYNDMIDKRNKNTWDSPLDAKNIAIDTTMYIEKSSQSESLEVGKYLQQNMQHHN